MSETAINRPAEPLQERLSRVAERFRDALNAVIDQVPVAIKRPAEFQRVLRLDRNLSSRLLRAARLHDPLATLHRMPGPHGVRLLLAAAIKAGVDRVTIAEAEHAVTELERVVATEVGTWQELNAAISGWLPNARAEFELTNRQTAYRAISNLRGVTADVELAVTIVHPAADDADWVDRAGITGMCRMKRLRPGAVMRLLHGRAVSATPGVAEHHEQVLVAGWSPLTPLPSNRQRFSIDGKPIDFTHGAPLLKEFSTSPSPELDLHVAGSLSQYVLPGDCVGCGSLADLLFADVMPRRYPAHASASTRPITPGVVVHIPVKVLVADVLVHRDVWRGVQPELRAFDTTGHGLADPTDPSCKVYRVDVLDPILDMGTRLDAFRVKEIGGYVDMIRHVCGKLGWDSTAFHGYRFRIEYPLYGTQFCMIFTPPPLAPPSTGTPA
ncbi:MAG: hypothetical protein PVJ57_21645 [Phycisphaerae bacterium]|jgi:hypothetical protein